MCVCVSLNVSAHVHLWAANYMPSNAAHVRTKLNVRKLDFLRDVRLQNKCFENTPSINTSSTRKDKQAQTNAALIQNILRVRGYSFYDVLLTIPRVQFFI